jgi:hypothetical protein
MSIGKFKTWFKYFALNSNAESRAKTKQTTFLARLIFLEKIFRFRLQVAFGIRLQMLLMQVDLLESIKTKIFTWKNCR